MALPPTPNTTYSPASTPAVKAQDLNDLQTYLSALYAAGQLTPGRARTLIERNGYRMSVGAVEFVDPWLFTPQASASGSPWTAALGTGAAIAAQAPNANYNTRYLQLTPSSTSGATNYCLMSTPQLFIANAAMNSVALEFELGLNAAAIGTASNVSWFAGFDIGTDPFGSDAQYAYIYKPYNATNYAVRTAGVPTANPTSPATAPSTNTNLIPVDRFKFEIHGTASPLAAYRMDLSINETPVCTVTTNLPTASAMRMVFGSANEGGAPSGSPLAFLGPVRLSYNYYLSPPMI